MKSNKNKKNKLGISLFRNASKLRLAIFVLIFASIGAYLLYQSRAATTRAYQALGVYPAFTSGSYSNAPGFKAFESWLGRELKYADLNLSHQCYTGCGAGITSGAWSNYSNADSFKTIPRVTTAITIPLHTRTDSQRGALLAKGGDAALTADSKAGLEATARGDNDSYYRTIAKYMVDNGHAHTILRLGHEPEIRYYPWSFKGGNHEVYKQAFRRVQGVMKAVPGNNFKFDYQGDGEWDKVNPNAGNQINGDAGYPGDEYVDIIGVDIYDRNPWSTIKARLDYGKDLAVRHGKPMSIPEWGLWLASDGGNGDNPTFIQNMYDWINALPSSGAGSIVYHSYFDGHTDSKLNQFPNAQAKFKTLFGTGASTTPTPTNSKPSTSITSPANNASFTAPATIGINANAADADGAISKVEFFQGSTKLGEDLTSPYQYNWTNVGVGTYALTSKATDNKGATTTSSPVSVVITSVPQPDLVITELTQSPVAPASGQAVTFSAVIKNQGNAATPNGVIHGVAFKVNGSTIGWSDSSTATLAPGATRSLTANNGPSGNKTWKASAGTFTIEAHVDDVNRITNESNESNNILSKSLAVSEVTAPPPTPIFPDLVITDISWTPLNPKVGENVTFNATIKNQGTGATPSGIVVGVLFKVDGGSVTWSDNNSSSLPAGATRTLTANSGANNKANWLAVAGTHTIEAHVDDVNRIVNESNESNNKLSKSLTTINQPTVSNPEDKIKPSQPTNLTTTLVSPSVISLTWSPSSDNTKVTEYQVIRNDALIASPTTNSFTDTNLTPNTEYIYKVKAVDTGTNISDPSPAISVSTIAAVSIPPASKVAPPPNTDTPLSITPVNSAAQIPVPSNEIPVVTGAFTLTNTSVPENVAKAATTKTVLKVDGRTQNVAKAKTSSPIDTTTLSNGVHTVTLETTAPDGSSTTTSRYISVSNDLNPVEKVRNFIFKPLAGKSGRLLNIFMGAGTITLTSGIGLGAWFWVRRLGGPTLMMFGR